MDLLYPRRCPLCNTVRPYQDAPVCAACFQKLKRVEAPYCMKCGKTLDMEEKEYCGDCRRLPKSFKRGFPAFFYEGGIKSALYAFKYKNQRNYAEFFADCICRYYENEISRLDIEGMVPVPIHARKRRKRGYNQAELLARQLAKRIQTEVYSDYLVRRVETSPQKELNDKARMKNLNNAFKIGENKIKLKKILLVDDIYTSGATIEGCTRVLLSAGAEEVYYTSVAVGRGYSG